MSQTDGSFSLAVNQPRVFTSTGGANIVLCVCNAYSLPHTHDSDGIHDSTGKLISSTFGGVA